MSQMELKFVNTSYFKQLFQTLRPGLQYSKNGIFVTSHFSTLFRNVLATSSSTMAFNHFSRGAARGGE